MVEWRHEQGSLLRGGRATAEVRLLRDRRGTGDDPSGRELSARLSFLRLLLHLKNGRALCEWEYQLLYIRAGSGVIEFERDKPIALSAGSLVLLHPGEWHRYRPNPKTGWSESYIGFGGDFCKNLISPPFFSASATVLAVPVDGYFDQQLEALIDEIMTTSAERPYSLATRTATLLASVIEHTSALKPENTHFRSIRKAQLFIAHHLTEPIDYPSLAKKSGMGYALFRKRFKSVSGLAPLEFQLALRIRRAANLLTSTDISIAQIAIDTGFRSPLYFARFFRKETGLSPIRYRRLHGGLTSIRE